MIKQLMLSMTVVAVMGLLTSAAYAQDTNSDLYTRCPAEREALRKYENNAGSKCQAAVARAAKCCNLAPGCDVQGIQAVATSGNVEGGAQLILALQALSNGITTNIRNCDNSEKSAVVDCLSSARGATPADKDHHRKYSREMDKLVNCLHAEAIRVQQQVLQAGGSVEASSERTPTSTSDHVLSPEEIVKALRGR